MKSAKSSFDKICSFEKRVRLRAGFVCEAVCGFNEGCSEVSQQAVPGVNRNSLMERPKLAAGIATRAEHASFLLVCFPLLQELNPILAQIKAAADSRIGRVTHDSHPENPVISFGVNAVCIMKVEGFQVLSPPLCIVKLG